MNNWSTVGGAAWEDVESWEVGSCWTKSLLGSSFEYFYACPSSCLLSTLGLHLKAGAPSFPFLWLCLWIIAVLPCRGRVLPSRSESPNKPFLPQFTLGHAVSSQHQKSSHNRLTRFSSLLLPSRTRPGFSSLMVLKNKKQTMPASDL